MKKTLIAAVVLSAVTAPAFAMSVTEAHQALNNAQAEFDNATGSAKDVAGRQLQQAINTFKNVSDEAAARDNAHRVNVAPAQAPHKVPAAAPAAIPTVASTPALRVQATPSAVPTATSQLTPHTPALRVNAAPQAVPALRTNLTPAEQKTPALRVNQAPAASSLVEQKTPATPALRTNLTPTATPSQIVEQKTPVAGLTPSLREQAPVAPYQLTPATQATPALRANATPDATPALRVNQIAPAIPASTLVAQSAPVKPLATQETPVATGATPALRVNQTPTAIVAPAKVAQFEPMTDVNEWFHGVNGGKDGTDFQHGGHRLDMEIAAGVANTHRNMRDEAGQKGPLPDGVPDAYEAKYVYANHNSMSLTAQVAENDHRDEVTPGADKVSLRAGGAPTAGVMRKIEETEVTLIAKDTPVNNLPAQSVPSVKTPALRTNLTPAEQATPSLRTNLTPAAKTEQLTPAVQATPALRTNLTPAAPTLVAQKTPETPSLRDQRTPDAIPALRDQRTPAVPASTLAEQYTPATKLAAAVPTPVERADAEPKEFHPKGEYAAAPAAPVAVATPKPLFSATPAALAVATPVGKETVKPQLESRIGHLSSRLTPTVVPSVAPQSPSKSLGQAPTIWGPNTQNDWGADVVDVVNDNQVQAYRALNNALQTQSEMIAAQGDISQLDQEVTGLTNAVGTMGQTVGKNQTDIADLQTKVGGIATNTTAISGLDGRVKTNEGNITTLQSGVSKNTSELTGLTTDVGLIHTDITNLQGDVAKKVDQAAVDASITKEVARADGAYAAKADVATNTTDITTLKGQVGGIATNTTAIATETQARIANDATLSHGINVNATDIATNKQGVADNKTAISTNTTAIAGKADKADVTANTTAIQTNATAITSKANQSDFVALQSNVAQKVDTSTFTQRSSVVDQRFADTDSRIAQQKAEQQKTNATVAQHTAELADHEARISDLESKNSVNFGKLKNQVEQNRKRASAGIAGVAAMANIPQVTADQNFSIGAGVGNTDGESALSVGFSARASQNVVVKGAVSNDTQHNFVVGAGVSYGW